MNWLQKLLSTHLLEEEKNTKKYFNLVLQLIHNFISSVAGPEQMRLIHLVIPFTLSIIPFITMVSHRKVDSDTIDSNTSIYIGCTLNPFGISSECKGIKVMIHIGIGNEIIPYQLSAISFILDRFNYLVGLGPLV